MDILDDRLRAGGAESRRAVDDVAGDGDDADLSGQVAGRVGADPAVIGDRLVAAGKVPLDAADEILQPLLQGRAVADPAVPPGPHRGPGGAAYGRSVHCTRPAQL